MKLHVVAEIPGGLVREWLQHLQDFDAVHAGCRFEIMADAPRMSADEVVELMRLAVLGFDVKLIERKR